jgi:hypothetical protein
MESADPTTAEQISLIIDEILASLDREAGNDEGLAGELQQGTNKTNFTGGEEPSR